MFSEKVSFKNREGLSLEGQLDLPPLERYHSMALFAHCFTCNSNFHAVRTITRALNQKGYAVLRFDFTGLGQSEGDFSETSFSSNIKDLVDAANFLKENYSAPELLIGHSLGGIASLAAAQDIASIKATVSIGAPADPEHVAHLFKSGKDKIVENGEAEVMIGGRPFIIKKDFLDDLKNHEVKEQLKKRGKPILIMHSPQDEVVGIDNARELYEAAVHPKSFISLDGADHLLNNKTDAGFAADMIGAWCKRYLSVEKEALATEAELVGYNVDQFVTEIQVDKHSFLADEPKDLGGHDLGPSPYQLVSAGLAACTAMTLRMYANHKKINLESVHVHLDFEKKHDPDKNEKIDYIKRKIAVKGDLDESQKKRLLEIADKCPVHKTLTKGIKIESELKD